MLSWMAWSKAFHRLRQPNVIPAVHAAVSELIPVLGFAGLQVLLGPVPGYALAGSQAQLLAATARMAGRCADISNSAGMP